MGRRTWSDDDIEFLKLNVEKAIYENKNLGDVFLTVAKKTNRKPETVKAYWYKVLSTKKQLANDTKFEQKIFEMKMEYESKILKLEKENLKLKEDKLRLTEKLINEKLNIKEVII